MNDGRQDGLARHSSRPHQQRNYRDASRGYNPDFGSRREYRAQYREAYEQGYATGYQEGLDRSGYDPDHRNR